MIRIVCANEAFSGSFLGLAAWCSHERSSYNIIYIAVQWFNDVNVRYFVLKISRTTSHLVYQISASASLYVCDITN